MYDWKEIEMNINEAVKTLPFFTMGELLNLVGVKKSARSSYLFQRVRKQLTDGGFKELRQGESKVVDGFHAGGGCWYKGE